MLGPVPTPRPSTRPVPPDHNPIEPQHYKIGGIEAIEVIEAWKLGFCLGNCVKYIQRHTLKNGLEDLKKARWYLDRKISQMEKEQENSKP